MELKIFEKSEFGSVRVVMKDGEPWFVASDVARALGYERPNDAVNAHCKKVNKFRYGDMPYGAQPYNIIPESDVYRLVMRSNLPAAVEFQDWICDEVIPSIRRTGGYLLDKPDDTPESIMARAVLFSRECHDCKKPTTQYRCPQCHEEWRRKHGVPEDACGEDIYLGAQMPEYFL